MMMTQERSFLKAQRQLREIEQLVEGAVTDRQRIDLWHLLGFAPSQRAAEQMNQQMAEHAESFALQHPAPPPDEEAELLVATTDGKGSKGAVCFSRNSGANARRHPLRLMSGHLCRQRQVHYCGAGAASGNS
jgi:hypothetical protein